MSGVVVPVRVAFLLRCCRGILSAFAQMGLATLLVPFLAGVMLLPFVLFVIVELTASHNQSDSCVVRYLPCQPVCGGKAVTPDGRHNSFCNRFFGTCHRFYITDRFVALPHTAEYATIRATSCARQPRVGVCRKAENRTQGGRVGGNGVSLVMA